MAAIAIKPVSVVLRAAGTAFKFYKSGVLNIPTCKTIPDHAVIAIGYGELNGTPYWLIRNSWGKSWGEAGYVKLFRGTANNAGMCGVLKRPSYPNI
jgi:cathepsin L